MHGFHNIQQTLQQDCKHPSWEVMCHVSVSLMFVPSCSANNKHMPFVLPLTTKSCNRPKGESPEQTLSSTTPRPRMQQSVPSAVRLLTVSPLIHC